jgi:hypothetical protein
MNTIVIYPGRFHPFHRGHKASYDFLAKQYGPDNVYIATSDVQAPITSPFSFADKQQMIAKLGIPTGHVVQVKNPYQATELLSQVADPANTQVIFAVSEKDMQTADPRFKFGVKKDGTPTKLQPMPKNPKDMKPMTDHFYLMVTPTVNFTDLYGEAYPELRDLFDKKLGASQQAQNIVQEARTLTLTEGARKRLSHILERIIQQEHYAQLHESVLFADESVELDLDYLEEKRGL